MRRFSLILAVLAIFGLTMPVWATEITAVQSGDWEDPATWGLENRCPDFFDDVVIPADVTVTINAPFPVPPEIEAMPGCNTLDVNLGSLVVEGTVTAPGGVDIVIIASGDSVGDRGPGVAGADDIVIQGAILGGRHVTLNALQGNVVITGTVTPGPGGRVFISGLNQVPAPAREVVNPKVWPVAQMPDGEILLEKIAAEEPFIGGSYNWSSFANPRTLNYIVSRETSSNYIHDRMLAPMLDFGEIADTLEPELAEAFWISEDGRSITIRFREGLTWSDSVAFDVARDIIEAYERVHMDPVFFDLELARFMEFCSVAGEPPTLEQIDERTVRFTWAVEPTGLEDPDVSPYTCLASGELGVPIPMHRLGPEVLTGDPDAPSEEYAEAFADAWGVATPPCPIGTERVLDPAQAPAAGEPCIVSIGPYIITSPVQLDVGASFQRNPWFWMVDDLGNRLPYLETLNYFIFENQDVMLLNFLNGTTDVFTPRAIDVAVIEEQAAALSIRLTTATSVSGYGAGFIGFNQENPARPGLSLAFFTPEVRRAMSNLMDRSTMVAALLVGFGQPHFQPAVATQFMLANTNPRMAPIVEELSFNPDRAAERLDNLGLVDLDGDGVRDIPAGWGIIVPGGDNVLQSTPAGDDFSQDECRACDQPVHIIYPGPNGILDTEAAGDDIALTTEEQEPMEFTLNTNEGNTFRERTIVMFAENAATVGIKITPSPITFVSLVRALLTPESDAWHSVVIGITGDWRGFGVLNSCGFLHLGDLVRSCDAAEGITPDIRIPYQKWVDEQAPLFLEAEPPAERTARSQQWQLVNAWHTYLVYHVEGLAHGAVREDRVANTGNFPIGTLGPLNLEVVFRVDL